jgi:hypothetical protein
VSEHTAIWVYSLLAVLNFAFAEMEGIQLIVQSAGRLFGIVRSRLRPVLHWTYSGVAIPFFFGMGVTMLLASRYSIAYASFALFGLWSVGYWLTSDWLLERRKRLLVRSLRRDARLLQKEKRRYFALEWGVSTVLVLFAAGCIAWAFGVKKQSEQEDVEQHLSGTVESASGDSPYRSVFVLVNGGQTDILRKQVRTYPRKMLVGHKIVATLPDVGFIVDPGPVEIPRNGGTDSRAFLPDMAGRPLACADVTLVVDYVLATQPAAPRLKQFRFVTRWSPDGLHWLSESVLSRRDFCFDKEFQAPYGNTY